MEKGGQPVHLAALPRNMGGEFKNIGRIMDRIQNAPMDLIGGNRDFEP